jgi:hypothetical protein
MRMVIASLSPEEIVFVGEFTRLWHHVRPTIERAVKEAVLVGKAPLVRPAAAEPSVARLRGTVALVLQEHFGFGLTRRLDGAGNPRKLNFRKAGVEVMSSY